MKFPSLLQSPDLRKQAFYAGSGIGVFLTILVLLCAPTLREWGYAFVPQSHNYKSTTDQSKKKWEKDIQRTKGNIRRLRQSLQYRLPREPYLIIDTSDNMFILMSRGKTLYRSVCSTGSYTLLKTKNKKEKWIFKTPRGLFRVQNIVENPIWRMPDWAFIEEGLPIPPEDSAKRFERGALGDYAFDLGHGYLIHGTLYQRFLGMPVTHGCVRLGDKELQIVYENIRVGSRVFIY